MFVGQMVFDEMTWSHHDPVFFLGATTEGRKKSILFKSFSFSLTQFRLHLGGGGAGGGNLGQKNIRNINRTIDISEFTYLRPIYM
jgi:hypothetical protein